VGITVDRKKLEDHQTKLVEGMSTLMMEFFEDSPATPHIKEYNARVVREHYDKMPDKLTKTGKVSVRFTKWQEKLEILKVTQHFNPNSKQQLASLIYDNIFKSTHTHKYKLGYAGHHMRTKTGMRIIQNTITIEDGPTIKWEGPETTREGPPLRKVDKSILPKLGRAGEILAEYNKLNKEAGYVKKMLECSEGGVHHGQLRVSGTKTDRCAGTGGLNLQQLPKSEGYLECLRAATGQTLIQMDIDALEAVVLAELSQCPSYMQLYGPGRPPNDVYLFIGSQIPQFREEITNAGYDPESPTAEGIKRAKKTCKRTRSICKILHLSSQYGAGANKIYETLREQGIQISLAEVTDIRKRYWEIFKGVTDLRERLVKEWQANKGFFRDGLGTPVTVHRDYDKDILNRCIQRTGHFILVKYLYHLSQIRKEIKHVPIKPVLPDFHDETVWQVEDKHKDKAKYMFELAWSRTNDELGGIIPLSGTPEIHDNFWGFKGD
jgi:hypothetical protein